MPIAEYVSSFTEQGEYIEIDVTDLVAHDLATDPNKVLSLTFEVDNGKLYVPMREYINARLSAPILISMRRIPTSPCLQSPLESSVPVLSLNQSLGLDVDAFGLTKRFDLRLDPPGWPETQASAMHIRRYLGLF